MKHFIVIILLIFTLIQCEFFPTKVTYSRPFVSAYVTDFEILPPFVFGNDSYKIAGAKFLVDGEIGSISNVRYKVYGTIRFCGGGKKDEIDIASDIEFIADTLYISNNTIHIGVGPEYLTVPIDVQAPRPDQQQYAGTVGVRIYYKSDGKEKQVSKSESYDYSNLYCN